MPKLQRDGATIRYRVQGEGPPIIVGHSLFTTYEMWDEVIQRLSDRFRLISIELRGHGESTAEVPFSLDDLVDDAFAVLDAEGIDAAAAGGLSTGGMVAMRMALRAPERVTALALCNTDAGSQPDRLRNGLLVYLYRWFGFIPAGLIVRSMHGETARREDPQLAQQFIEKVKLFHRLPASRTMQAVFARRPLDLSGIKVPTLVIGGEEDFALPPARSRHIAEQITGARLEVIPNAGHLSAVEQPAVVADLFRDFFSGVFALDD